LTFLSIAHLYFELYTQIKAAASNDRLLQAILPGICTTPRAQTQIPAPYPRKPFNGFLINDKCPARACGERQSLTGVCVFENGCTHSQSIARDATPRSLQYLKRGGVQANVFANRGARNWRAFSAGAASGAASTRLTDLLVRVTALLERIPAELQYLTTHPYKPLPPGGMHTDRPDILPKLAMRLARKLKK